MKIATLNLRHDVDRWEERRSLVVNALADEDADIIALQEVALTSPQAQQIEDGLRELGIRYTSLVAPKWQDKPREGIAIFVRGNLLQYEHVNLPEGNRIAQRVQIEIDGYYVNAVNVHLHHRPRDSEVIRLRQMRYLLDWMRSRADSNWFLAGDFNALPESETLQIATTWLKSSHLVMHGFEPITHPTPLNPDREPGMSLSIDYVLYDPETFRLTNAYRFADNSHQNDKTLYPSDHFGVVACFEPLISGV